MKESAEETCRFLPPDAQSAVVLEPADGAFDDPAALVPSERAAILGLVLRTTVAAMRRDEFDALLREFVCERVTVVGHVADQALGVFVGEHEVEHGLDQLTLMRLSRACGDRHRQAAGIDHHHDFHAFSDLCAADAVAAAPRFAERAVDETLIDAVAVALFNTATGVTHELLEETLTGPLLKPAMHGALATKPSRKILPLRAVGEHPEDAADDLPRVADRRSALQRPRRIRHQFDQKVQLYAQSGSSRVSLGIIAIYAQTPTRLWAGQGRMIGCNGG